MKLFVVLATFCAAANALPQSYGTSSSHSGLQLLQDLEHSLPEGCTFISSSKEESADGVITGEYSYKDPIGSTITVTYSVNADGTNYTESRKILKAYETDLVQISGSGLITVTEVVQQISSDLESTVISIIKKLVLSANIDLGNSAAFVDTIMVQLRPVVKASVNTALATSQYQHLSANDLIEQIIINLRPFVVEALRKEVIAVQQQQSLITVEQVVKEISLDLEPTVIRIIKTLVASANIDLGQTNSFVDTIMVQLRPVVEASVNNALATSKYQHLSALELIEQITINLRPFVVEALRKEVIAVQQKPQISEAQVVELVINQLRETIIAIIRQTVSASSFDVLNNEDSLVNAILTQLNGVVLTSVQNALKVNGITTLNDQSLTAKIILEITPFVKAGVSQQIEEAKQAEAARQEAARREAARLEAARQEAARREAARLEAARREAARIEAERREAARKQAAEAARREAARIEAERKEAARLEALRIEAERKEAARLEALRIEAERKEAARLEALRIEAERQEAARLEALRIEAERKEAARLEALRIEKERQEAARLEAERAEAARLALLKKKQELVTIIIKKLEPIVIRVIRTTVRSAKVDLDNYQNLASTISTQLRPVVFAEVSGALLSSQYQGLDAKDMTDRIVVELKPFIKQGIETEVTVVKQQKQQANADVLIKKIIQRLRPIVIQVIQTTVRQQSVDLSNTDALVATIMQGLEPVVLEEVRGAIASTGATYLNAEDMTAKIILQLRPFVVQGVTQEIKVVKQEQGNNNLISTIITQITPAIQQSVNDALTTETIEPATASQVSTTFLTKLRPVIQKMIIEIMQTSGKGITDENRLIELVFGEFQQGFLLGLITDEVKVALGPNVRLPSVDEIQKLLDSLRPQIRRIVIEEISLFKEKNTLSADAQQSIIDGVVGSLRQVIKQGTAEYLISNSGVSDEAALSALLAKLQPIVIQNIEKEVSGLQIFQSGAFQNSDAFAQLMAEIMAQIRLIIIQEIQLFRREQARIAAAAAAAAKPVAPAPAPQTALVSIFGTGKGNSVKVNTPDYKFKVGWA